MPRKIVGGDVDDVLQVPDFLKRKRIERKAHISRIAVTGNMKVPLL